MATLKKVTLTPKKASKPPVVVVKKEKFNAEREIKVILERLKDIDSYITRSDNADTKDKQKFEKFIETASSRMSAHSDGFQRINEVISEIKRDVTANQERIINLAADWGKQKNQTETSIKALVENQMGNEMAIEAVEEGYKKSASLAWSVAMLALIASVGSIAMQIYAYYH